MAKLKMKYIPVNDRDKYQLHKFPSIFAIDNEDDMLKTYWKDDLLIRSGNLIFNVSSDLAMYYKLVL